MDVDHRDSGAGRLHGRASNEVWRRLAGIEWSRYEPVSRRLIVFCVVAFDSLLHVRQWILGMSPASVGMFGPYYDEFWTTIWILAALLLASSIRRELHAK